MELVKVGNRLTLEETGVIIDIKGDDILQLSKNRLFDAELDDYTLKTDDFGSLLKNKSTSRRLVLTYPVSEDSENHCITLIQVLFGRDINKLFVYFRSSEASRLSSDLGFVCRLAKLIDNVEVKIFIGSLHTYVELI